MKKYPYISTTMNNLLFYAKDTATLIGDESNQFSHGFKLTVDESKCENNAKEYLSNTWGVVESKEHAEFIIELAIGCEIDVAGTINLDECGFFSFAKCYEGPRLVFLEFKDSIEDVDKRKQITIPLPPKAKEWPQVGDEVLIDLSNYDPVYGQNLDGLTCKVLSIFKDDDTTVYVVNRDGVNYCFVGGILQKPKSNQELLIEELQTKLCNNKAVDNYILACDIINGDIEGLSYEV